MVRCHFVSAVFLLTLLFWQAVAARPNIVFIVADDLGWSDVGFHSGSVKTPNLDALAYNGVTFKRHYSQPLCTPSRTALLTGDYPIRHGMQGFPCVPGVADGLSTDVKLMPEYFSELGYKTHLVGKWHLGFETKEHLPTRRGFETFFGYLNGYLGYWDGIHYYGQKAARDFRRGEEKAWREVYGKYLTEVLTNEAVSVIEKHNETENLLLFLNHDAVHTTYLNMVREAPPNTKNNTGRGILQEMVRWMDWSVGKVVDALHKKNILNDTIIVFISDNGAPTQDTMFENYSYNWPLRGLKVSVHEGGVRTAALLYSSLLQEKPRVTTQLFHISDWLPTLYTAAGGDIKNLAAKDGMDQWSSLVSGTEGPRTETLVEIDEVTHTEAYIMDNWKLLRNHNPKNSDTNADKYYGESGDWMTYDIEEVRNSTVGQILGTIPENWAELKSAVKIEGGSCPDKRAAEEYDCHSKYCLFDLETDPSECTDVAAQNATLVQLLQRLLDFYRRVLVPQTQKIFDDRANPKKFGDYWSPWLDSNEISRE